MSSQDERLPPPRWTVLPGRGVLRLAGIDPIGFLQSLVSNDVSLAGPDWSVYTVLATPQGKVLHDFFVVAESRPEAGDALLLEVEAARRDDLLERLHRYRLRAKVGFEDLSSELEVLALIGGTAATSVGLPETPGATAPFGAGLAFVDPRLAGLGVRVLAPAGESEALAGAAGAVAASFEDYELLRLELGVPDGSRDLGVGQSLLLEGNLDSLNAISWTKGCYIGQEVTARTRYRGLVRRRLQPVRVTGPLPPPGTPVLQGEREAGEVCSGCGSLALALLRLEALESPDPPLTAAGAILTPLEPGWAHP